MVSFQFGLQFSFVNIKTQNVYGFSIELILFFFLSVLFCFVLRVIFLFHSRVCIERYKREFGISVCTVCVCVCGRAWHRVFRVFTCLCDCACVWLASCKMISR